MLSLINYNLNNCPKTKANIIWDDIRNGIKISKEDIKYLLIKDIIFLGNGKYCVEFLDGDKYYCLYEKLHREDGPAVEWRNGGKEYWLHGTNYSEDQYELKAAINYLKNVTINSK